LSNPVDIPPPAQEQPALEPEAVGPLLDALSDEDVTVRTRALHALLQLPLSIDSQRSVSMIASQMLWDERQFDPDLVQTLARVPTYDVRNRIYDLLSSSDPSIRHVAARALAEVQDPTGKAQLHEDLRSDDPVLRVDAAEGISMLDPEPIRSELLDLALADDEPEIRLWTSIALARAGDPAPLERVLEQLARQEIELQIVWGDPMVLSARFEGRGPFPETTIAMLERSAAVDDRDASLLATTLLEVAAVPEVESDEPVSPREDESLIDDEVRAFLQRWRSIIPNVATDLPASELGSVVADVLETIVDGQSDSWQAFEAGNDLVTLVGRFQSQFDPDIQRLFQVFETSRDRINIRDQVAWLVSRPDMGKVISALAPAMAEPDRDHRRSAVELIDLAATYSHINVPPTFGGGTTPTARRPPWGIAPREPDRIEVTRVGEAPAVRWAPWSMDPRESAMTGSAPPGPPDEDVAMNGDEEEAEFEEAEALQSTKEISAWVEERADGSSEPLVVDEPYTLSFKVGSPVTGSLLSGQDTGVRESDIPERGLYTTWTITSSSVELQSISSEVMVRTRESAAEPSWAARFNLNVGREMDSDTVKIRIIPRRNDLAQLNILIDVFGDPWREFTIDLSVRPAEVAEQEPATGPVAKIVDEIILKPANQVSPYTWHEWTTPSGTLSLNVDNDGGLWVQGRVIDQNGVEEVFSDSGWGGQKSRVSGLIGLVRAKAEDFRATHQSYLNDIEADDLLQRLQAFEPIYDWAHIPDQADDAHRAAWNDVATSKELRELAQAGYVLYERCFPNDDKTPVRGWLDRLSPGYRLDIRWLESANEAVTHMPWGLMYMRDTSQPIDPIYFMGMRFRINYVKRRVASRIDLGAPDVAFRSHYLYWGADELDPVAEEARRQRELWSTLGQKVVLPEASPEVDSLERLISFLGNPQPSPMTLLYFFCQCTFDQNKSPELWFGLNENQRDIINLLMDVHGGDFPDRPLVFMNACGTAAADPDKVNELEIFFAGRKARAYIGTEALVPIQLASRFATVFFYFFYRQANADPIAAGEAVSQARMFLWSHFRNIGGLLYTYVDQFNVFLADAHEVSHT
jgi:hypothetical protein